MDIAQSDRGLLTALKKTSQVCSLGVVLIGCVVLLGWVFDIPTIKSILPQWVTMKANAALGFVFAGIGLYFLQSTSSSKRRFAQGCALFVTILGLLNLSQYAFGWNLGIDQLLFTEESTAIATSNPGRMAAVTAFNFTLMGIALWLLLGRIIPYQLVQLLALITALITLQVVIGYIYGAELIFGLAFYTFTALHTAIAFFILSLGILFAAPEQGWMSLFISNTAGGITARVLIPAAVAIPFILGWLQLLGERIGWFDEAFGLSLHVTGNVVAFLGLTWYCAQKLAQVDLKRQLAKSALRDSYAQLEMRVEERTSELSESNAALEQSLRELADIKFALDASSIVAITDAKGIISYVNDKFCELSQFSRAELIGQTHRIINSGYHPQSFFTQMWKTISQGAVWQGEIKNRAKDGSFYWVATTIVPFVDDCGKPYQYIAIRSDITNRKTAELAVKQLNETLEQRVQERTTQLAEVNQELKRFAYSVSHDLRSPLRAIRGLIEALVEDNGDGLDELGHEYAHHIADSAQRMDRLIQDLLAYSRLSQTEIQLQIVDLTTVISEILQQLAPERQAKQAEITVAQPLPQVIAQRTILTQVLINLLTNSLKYVLSGVKPQIEVWAENRQDWVRIWVTDNGIGIEPEFQERIFGVFERLHSSDTYSGTGVGLAIVQKGIERLGGRVGVESELGKGSRFWLELRQG